MKRLPWLRDVGLDLLTLCILFVVLLPILWVFLASVRPGSDIASGGWIPQRFTIRHYQEIIAFPGFLVALKNSLIVGITVAVITTTMAVPAAYALSRLSFRGRNLFALIILGTQMLPSVAVLVPLVVIVRQIGLSNTLTALIFTHLSLGMPIAVWMLRGYIDRVPRELEEAALIDGCGRIGAMVRVVLPLIRPAIVAVGTFAFVLSWGEFILALALISKADAKTLPLALQGLFDPYSFSWGRVMAGGTIIALPTILLFLIFRKQLVGGVSRWRQRIAHMSLITESIYFTGPYQLEVREETLPDPQSGEVVIEASVSGISAGTELNVDRGLAPQWRQRMDPATRLFSSEARSDWKWPARYGYAMVGRIIAVGDRVSACSPGDLVFAYAPHGRHAIVNHESVIPLPETQDEEIGVFLPNFNTAYNGVLDANLPLGGEVVVMGLGVVGQLVVRLLKRGGARTIVGVDHLALRRDFALRGGAITPCSQPMMWRGRYAD